MDAPESSDSSSPTGRRRLALLAAVAAAVVGADQLTKAWALSALRDHSRHVVGTIDLRLTRNTGGAFSLFTGRGAMLAVLGVVVVVLLVQLGRQEADWWVLLALSLVLGGALGNLADRVFRGPGWLNGAVVDFIDIGRWPTFNLADAAITVGAVVLVLRGWQHHEQPDHEQPASD